MAEQRKRSAAVDVQLELFEEDLRTQLEYYLIVNCDRDFWYENDELSADDKLGIEQVIDAVFNDIINRYQNVRSVHDILQYCRILLQNVVWASVNVPFPRRVDAHLNRVVTNTLEVYYATIYPQLRTEIVMMIHHCEVIQRTWRRCYYEPYHPVCRRRLIREFEELAI
jgi:hypothetical protein